MSVSSDISGELFVPSDSPGSSVSTRLQEEYDELLKYAVIMPTAPQATTAQSFPLFRQLAASQDTTQDDLGQDEDHTLEEGCPDLATVNGSGVVAEDCGNEGDVESEGGAHIHIHQQSSSTPRDGTPVQGLVYAAEQETKYTSGHTKLQQVRQFVQQVRAASPNDSVASSRYTEDLSQVMYSAGVDPDIARMEGLLDQWTLDLKRNVLAEYSQCKIKTLEQHKQEMVRMKERYNAEKNQLHNEIETMKELLHTYEKSIERKDQVISNLTGGIQKQKEKYEMLRTFCEWKIRHNDSKKEAFASTLAHKHHERRVKRRAYDAWHSLIENNWRARVEKACQAKAQEVCLQLTDQYEAKIAELNAALASAREEVTGLSTERDKYEENMKKAFMRGVCALNMEAMAMFSDDDRGVSTAPGSARDSEAELMPDNHQQLSQAFSLHATGSLHDMQHEPSGPQREGSLPAGAMPTSHRVVTSRASVRTGTSQAVPTQSKSITTGMTRKTKTSTPRVAAKVDSGRGKGGSSGTLAPPMSSVVVERHPPVNKQTIGQATASQFPSRGNQVPGVRKPTTSSVNVTAPHLQTIKVVE